MMTRTMTVVMRVKRTVTMIKGRATGPIVMQPAACSTRSKSTHKCHLIVTSTVIIIVIECRERHQRYQASSNVLNRHHLRHHRHLHRHKRHHHRHQHQHDRHQRHHHHHQRHNHRHQFKTFKSIINFENFLKCMDYERRGCI